MARTVLRYRRSVTGTTVSPRQWLALGLLVVLLFAANLQAVHPTGAAPFPAPGIVAAHPPGLHAALRPAGHPAAGSSWYTQEGATVAQWDGSTSRGTLPTVTLSFRLVPSPVSIGYELNGLSDVGDWYQLVIAENWPGCANGYEEVTEVWSNAGASGAVVCDPTLTLHTSDLIVLNLSFDASAEGCLTVDDRSTGQQHASCVAPPDTGGTGFVTVQGTSDSNGYFTGPMTEVLNQTATTCPDYPRLPTVGYSFLRPAWVSEYVPWADEFEYGGSGTYCFGGSPGTEVVGANDPTTYYFDNAAGSGFGSRWGGGQNESLLLPNATFRYQTDPRLLASVSASASSLLLAVGGSTILSAAVYGGVAPYTALWSENGTFVGNRNLSWTWNATSSGTTSFVAYGVDSQNDVVGPSNIVQIYIPGPLSVSRIFASPGSGSIDVNQTVVLSVVATGGVSPYTFLWSGLPTGCAAQNLSNLTCVPSAAGMFAVEVELRDGNGTVVGSPTMIFDVVSDPVALFQLTPGVVEAGQPLTVSATASGGAGTLRYNWSSLPPGCSGSTSRFTCVPTAFGEFPVGLTVSDTNGFALVLPTFDLVVDARVGVVASAAHLLTDLGQPDRITATVTGGGGTFSFGWYGLPSGCLGVNASTLVCEPTATGDATVFVIVSDSLGGTSQSLPVDLTISPALIVALTASPSSVAAGNAVNLSALVEGGSGAFAYSWSGLPLGCVAPDGPSLLCAPNSAGTSVVRVAVTDASGETVVATLNLSVTGGNSGLFSIPGVSSDGAIALVVLAVAVAAAGVIAVQRRRSPPSAGNDDDADSDYR